MVRCSDQQSRLLSALVTDRLGPLAGQARRNILIILQTMSHKTSIQWNTSINVFISDPQVVAGLLSLGAARLGQLSNKTGVSVKTVRAALGVLVTHRMVQLRSDLDRVDEII